MSIAGKMQMITELLGNEPVYDENGGIIGYTPKLISKETALELLNIKNHESVSETGKKFDTGKPRMELLSGIALQEVAKVLAFGATKYDAHNWRGGLKWSRILGAALRHIFAYLGGEDKDPETGLSHIAHAACCMMFLLEYEVTHKELDDRFKSEIKSEK